MGNVEMIRKKVCSSSRCNDLLLGETLSLHTSSTGSQSCTSFLLTCLEARMVPAETALASLHVHLRITAGRPGTMFLHASSPNALCKSAVKPACSLHSLTATSATLSSIILSTSHRRCFPFVDALCRFSL